MALRIACLVCVSVMLAGVAYAQSTLEKIGGAIGKGTQAVGKTVSKGANAISESIDSTSELLRDEETPAQTRVRLDAMEAEILARLLAENEQAKETLQNSAGYAAFDMRQVTIFPVSGGYGRGVAVSGDGTRRVYMEMGTGGVGAAFGIGGFASQFVIMFETPVDFDRFVTAGYDAGADAGVMAGEDRASETVQFTDGRSTFVLDKTGWRVNANLTGTKYWRDADLNY